VHRPAAGVGAGRQDGLGQHVVDPVLDAQAPVGERDRAVVQQVGAAALGHQVLSEAATAAQVEAQRRRGQRRHEQHRRPVEPAVVRFTGLDVVGRQPEHRPARATVDQRSGHRPEIGQAVTKDLCGDVGRGSSQVFRSRQHAEGPLSTTLATVTQGPRC